MLTLSSEAFKRASDYVMGNARELERSLIMDRFVSPCDEDVLRALSKYQNKDGGFGNALEPDFRLPLSSPMSTSKAFEIIKAHDGPTMAQPMIISGIRYLENTYNDDRKGWYAVPKEVNDYPHASWWSYDEKTSMTVIDNSWGNPSADIIGVLYTYREHVNFLDINSLVSYAIDYLKKKESFSSQHETYCFINLQKSLPERLSKSLDGPLTRAVSEQVCYDVARWAGYEPRPLDFVNSPDARHYGIPNERIDENLDYLVRALECNDHISPHWDTSDYVGGLRVAINEWKGNLTLRALVALDSFSRIEK